MVPDRVLVERLVALVLVVTSLVYFLLGWRIPLPDVGDDSPFSARSFPLALGAIGTVLSLMLLLRPSAGPSIGVRTFAWARAAGLLLMMFLYALLINHLGFVVTSALFLACAFRVLGERRIFVLTTVAAGVSLGLWLLFRMLDVRLDWGLFGRLLS